MAGASERYSRACDSLRDLTVALAQLLPDQLLGVPGRRRFVGERFHLGLALRAGVAEPDRDLGPLERNLPELVGASFAELEPPHAHRECRGHCGLSLLGCGR